MEIIILAGGYGTRLQSVVKDVPKPMADIKGRPFLSYLLDSFAVQGATRVLLSVGYKHDVVSGCFGDRYKNLKIEYVREETPLGTGGALRKALSHAREDTVIAANGDSFLELDLQNMLKFHQSRHSALTLAVKPMKRTDRYGTVLFENEKVVRFLEKSLKQAGSINGGVYAIDRKRVLELLSGYAEPFSFERDFLQKSVENLDIFVYSTTGYFIDIGVPEDYARARSELDLRGKRDNK